MSFAVASGDVWPLAGAEPGIEGVFVAAISFAATLDFDLLDMLVENPVGRIVDVLEGWNWDTPRDLAGNVPVAKVSEIVDENLFFAGWVEFDLPCP